MNEMARLAHQTTATGEGEGVPAIEPRMLAYELASPGALYEDRGNATLERRGMRMAEPT